MQRLPKWMICDKFPSVYDLESATAIEQTAKVYGAMQKLIEEYNNFAERVNKIIDDFETYATKENEEFRVALRQEFQDFIDIINLKVKAQDKEIADKFKAIIEEIEARFTEQDNAIDKAVTDMFAELRERLTAQDEAIEEAIVFMKNEVKKSVTEIIENMIEDGEIDETIANAFNSMSARVTAIEENIVNIQTEINELWNGINALIEKDGEHDAEIEELKKVDEKLREDITIFTTVEGNAPLTIEDTKTGVIFDMEIEGRNDIENSMVVNKIMAFKKYNLLNPYMMVDEYVHEAGLTYVKNPDGSYQRNGASNSSTVTWSNAVLYGVSSYEEADINNTMFEMKWGKYYVLVDCKIFVGIYDEVQKKFIGEKQVFTPDDTRGNMTYVGHSSDETYKGFGRLDFNTTDKNCKIYCIGLSPRSVKKLTNWKNDVIYPAVIEVEPEDAYEKMYENILWKPYGDGAKVVEFIERPGIDNAGITLPGITPTTKICKRAGVWGIENNGVFETWLNELTGEALYQEDFNNLMVFDGDTIIDVHGVISGTDTFTNSCAKVKLTYMGNNQIALVLSDLLTRVTALENKQLSDG